MIRVPVRTEVLMGTIVTIQVVCDDSDEAIDRAFGWFHEIESRCSRFDEHSELVQLSMQVGVPVPVSPILFEAVRFALRVSEETAGAFDPTVGLRMELSDRRARVRSRGQSVAGAEMNRYRASVHPSADSAFTGSCKLRG